MLLEVPVSDLVCVSLLENTMLPLNLKQLHRELEN